MKKEFCIMPADEKRRWNNERFYGSHRHEVFGGANRQLSIDDGLVIFLSPALHDMSDLGIHFNKKFRQEVQNIGRETWKKYYNKTEEDFIKRYGKSFREVENEKN